MQQPNVDKYQMDVYEVVWHKTMAMEYAVLPERRNYYLIKWSQHKYLEEWFRTVPLCNNDPKVWRDPVGLFPFVFKKDKSSQAIGSMDWTAQIQYIESKLASRVVRKVQCMLCQDYFPRHQLCMDATGS